MVLEKGAIWEQRVDSVCGQKPGCVLLHTWAHWKVSGMLSLALGLYSNIVNECELDLFISLFGTISFTVRVGQRDKVCKREDSHVCRSKVCGW